jgi:hypothetical protein
MGAVRDKEKVKAFVNGPLKTWMLEQSTAIEVLSAGAAGLSGYARGVAAIEAGIAELRLVDKMRSAPTPASWDADLKAAYEAALDEALEPRKRRGRDAALVGMNDFARAGITRDVRLERARTLLSKLYGGRRIDALDALLLPPAPAESGVKYDGVPAFWFDHSMFASLVSAASVYDLGVPARRRVQAKALLGRGVWAPELAAYARARLDLGRISWRRVDFVEAATAAARSASNEERLVLAVALALAKGPSSAVEMMRAETPLALGLMHTEALDALVAERGPLAGFAAYNAAHLRALCPPDGPEAAPYLADVAARFRAAETLLGQPADKTLAAQRARDIDAIVRAAGQKAR